VLCIVQGVRLVKGHRHRFLVRSSVQHIVDDGLGSSRLGYSPGRQACEGPQATPSTIEFGDVESVEGHMLNQLAHDKKQNANAYTHVLEHLDRTEHDRTEQDRTGQDRTGQARPCQRDRTGKDRTKMAAHDETEQGRPAYEGTGVCRC